MPGPQKGARPSATIGQALLPICRESGTRGRPFMLTVKRKWLLLTAFTALLSLAWLGCNGFFVDPTLTSLAVTTLQSTTLPAVGDTVQLIATGAYDDNTHKDLTSTATWTATPTGFVSLST